jgi:uncharacterized protein with PIN domain
MATDLQPRFLVDGMAVRLGKYLRCLGYDAEWERGAGTRELAARARADGRALLTRNTRLGTEIEPPPAWLVLASEDPVAQLAQVVETFQLDPGQHLFTRCIRCNVELEGASPEEIAARVIEPVRARHNSFFRCPSCGTVFWRGSHVENTCRKLGLAPPREPPPAENTVP